MSEKLNKDQLSRARALYFDDNSITGIAKTLQVPRTSIQYYVNKEWKAERRAAASELMRNLADAKKKDIAAIYKNSLTALSKSIEFMAKQPHISIQEAKGITSVLDTIDKITRLDDGSATDITETVQPKTLEELRDELKAIDPFDAISSGEQNEENVKSNDESNEESTNRILTIHPPDGESKD